MRQKSYLFLLSIFLVAVDSGYAFDRGLWHQNSLGPIDLEKRALLRSAIKQPTVQLSADLTDLLISESISPATFNQTQASTLALKSSGWLVAFQDNRLGSAKIFWQILDDNGVSTGSNQVAASSDVGADYSEPLLASDTLGRIFFFYRDQTNGLLFGNRYSSALDLELGPFLVNDTGGGSYAGPFDVAIYPNGRMVVVWENYSPTGSTIQMRIYNNTGSSVVGPVAVNSDGEIDQHWVPSVSCDPDGDFLIGWEDYRNGQADIYVRLYNGSGVPLGSETGVVPPAFSGFAQYAPEIAFSPADEFLIGWLDGRIGQEVYGQKYTAASGLENGNFNISGSDVLYVHWHLKFIMSPDNKLLASWASFGPQNKIILQKFTLGFAVSGLPLTVNEAVSGQRWEPSLNCSEGGSLGLAWTEIAATHPDIHFNLFDSSGMAILSTEVKLNDDAAGAVSSQSAIIALSGWYNAVAFVDERNDDGDIYSQTISNSGVKYGGNIKVSQDVGLNLQAEPSMAMNQSGGELLVVWVDSRDVNTVAGQRIFGRFGDNLGQYPENEFIISDSSSTSIKTQPKAVFSSTGQGLVAWLDYRHGFPQVYGRFIAPSGQPAAAEMLISDLAVDSSNADLSVVADASDNFYVIWLDRGLAIPSVKVEWFNAAQTQSGSFSWISSIVGVPIDRITASVNNLGQVVLAWTGLESPRRLYLTVLQNNGAVIVPPQEIADDLLAEPVDPAITVSNINYVNIAWVDHRLGRRAVYYQIYDNGLQEVGGNTIVSTANPEMMLAPATSGRDGRAWVSWTDPRSNGMNIYAATFVYLPTDVDDNDDDALPISFHLSQNYPNPFNPTTEISFALPQKSDITLEIFNLLGQKVSHLASGSYEAGTHLVVWNGRNDDGQSVTSGLYFYRLNSEQFSETKKMLLLK